MHIMQYIVQICNTNYTIHIVQCMVYTIQCRLHYIHYTIHSIHYTLQTTVYILYYAWYTLFINHLFLSSVGRTSSRQNQTENDSTSQYSLTSINQPIKYQCCHWHYDQVGSCQVYRWSYYSFDKGETDVTVLLRVWLLSSRQQY